MFLFFPTYLFQLTCLYFFLLVGLSLLPFYVKRGLQNLKGNLKLGHMMFNSSYNKDFILYYFIYLSYSSYNT